MSNRNNRSEQREENKGEKREVKLQILLDHILQHLQMLGKCLVAVVGGFVGGKRLAAVELFLEFDVFDFFQCL